MKMEIREILEAVPAMNKLIAADLPLRTAHQLSVTADKLEAHLKFFDRKRNAINEKAAPDQDRELEKLLSYQVDVQAAVVEIPLEEDIRLSAADVMHLRRLVRFVGKGASKGN